MAGSFLKFYDVQPLIFCSPNKSLIWLFRDDKDELVEDSPADEVGSFHEGSGGKGKGDVDILDEAQKPKKRGFTTFWGPIGFKKKLHPLSIMVSQYEQSNK